MNAICLRAIYFSYLSSCLRLSPSVLLSWIVFVALYLVTVRIGHLVLAVLGVPPDVLGASLILPGLLAFVIATENMTNSAVAILETKLTGAIYAILASPVSVSDFALGYIGAAATRSVFLSALTLLGARFFGVFSLSHPLWAVVIVFLSSMIASLCGLLLGFRVNRFWKVAAWLPPVLIPLAFLGGAIYSVDRLPVSLRQLTVVDPLFYVVGSLNWCFGQPMGVSLLSGLVMMFVLLILLLPLTWWTFRAGYALNV